MLQLFSQTYAKETKLSEDTVFFTFKMLNLLLTAICIREELKKMSSLLVSHFSFTLYQRKSPAKLPFDAGTSWPIWKNLGLFAVLP